LADHRWVIVTMHDVKKYAVRNGLDHIVPFVEAACAAAERHLGKPDARLPQDEAVSTDADDALALVLNSFLNPAPIDTVSSDNLRKVSGMRRMRPH
jgi:hypothetical protein